MVLEVKPYLEIELDFGSRTGVIRIDPYKVNSMERCKAIAKELLMVEEVKKDARLMDDIYENILYDICDMSEEYPHELLEMHIEFSSLLKLAIEIVNGVSEAVKVKKIADAVEGEV